MKYLVGPCRIVNMWPLDDIDVGGGGSGVIHMCLCNKHSTKMAYFDLC